MSPLPPWNKKKIIKFEELPKLSDVIINKDLFNDVPGDYKGVLGDKFSLIEMDHKFINTLFFIFITKKIITKKALL